MSNAWHQPFLSSTDWVAQKTDQFLKFFLNPLNLSDPCLLFCCAERTPKQIQTFLAGLLLSGVGPGSQAAVLVTSLGGVCGGSVPMGYP